MQKSSWMLPNFTINEHYYMNNKLVYPKCPVLCLHEFKSFLCFCNPRPIKYMSTVLISSWSIIEKKLFLLSIYSPVFNYLNIYITRSAGCTYMYGRNPLLILHLRVHIRTYGIRSANLVSLLYNTIEEFCHDAVLCVSFLLVE